MIVKKEKFIFEIVKNISDSHSLSYNLFIKMADCVIRVNSNEEKIVKLLEGYYSEFLVSGAVFDLEVNVLELEKVDFNFEFITKLPDAGKTKIKEEYADFEDGRIIRKVLTGMVFCIGSGVNLAVGSCVENYNQIVNFINNRFIELMLKENCLLFHAAGVTIDDKAVVISGFSGAGKSTVALKCLAKGANFLSNDRIIMEKQYPHKLYGVAKLPRVNPGTIVNNNYLKEVIPENKRKEYLQLEPQKLWDLEEKHDIFIDKLFGRDRFVLSSIAGGLVVLNWKKNTARPTAIEKVNLQQRLDLMPAFMKATGLFFWSENQNFDFSKQAYLKALESIPVYEVTGSVNFEFIADKIMGLLII